MITSRRFHQAGSAFLLVASGAHLAAHWRAYVATDDVVPARRAVIDAMRAYRLHDVYDISLWTALGAFSLSFAALLALLGTTHWILAREAEPRVLRRHALRLGLLCGLATIGLGLLHPLPWASAIFALATLLFALAAWPRGHDP
jgi:hypothetical protein